MTADQSPPTADLAPLSEARLAEIRAHVSRSEYTRDMHALLPSSPSAFLSGRPDRSGKTRTAGACTRKDTRGSVTRVSPGSPRLQSGEEWDRAADRLVTDSQPRDAIVDASRSTVETEAEQSRSPAMGATDKPLGLSQELLTWHDIVHPDSRLYGMSFVGAEWPEYLSVRSEGQSVLPEEYRLKVSTTPDKPDQY